MDCSIAAKLVEMLRVSKCFGECVCDCDLHDPQHVGEMVLVYIYIYIIINILLFHYYKYFIISLL